MESVGPGETRSVGASTFRWGDLPAFPALKAAAIGGGLIAFIAAVYVVTFWNDVPYYDEWLSVPYAAEVATGSWAITDIFEPGQGHTGAAYRLMTIISTVFLHYDPRLTILTGFACLIASAVALTSRYTSIAKSSPFLFTVTMLGVWAALFTLHNWENLLATWLINSASSLLFAIAALTLADKNARLSFALALLCALACALCFTNGNLIWPSLALLLWLGDKKKRIIPTAICAGGLFVWVWFTHDQLGSKMNLMNVPGRFFAELGAPFVFQHAVVSLDSPMPAWAPSAAIAIGFCAFSGIVGLILWQTRFLRDYSALKTMRFSLALTLYGLGSVGLIALGRSDLEVVQAMSSRYVATTMIVYLGLILMVLEGGKGLGPKIFGATASAALVLAFVYAVQQEFSTGPYRYAYTANWRQVVLNYKTVSDEQLANPLHDPNAIREWSATMEQLNLGPFARKAGSNPPTSQPSQ